MLNVSDIDRSLSFYEHNLGFKRVSSDQQLKEWRWARLVNDNLDFMVMETDSAIDIPKGADSETNRGWPAQLYFHLEDVETLHQSLTSKGNDVSELRATKHGLMEFSMQDPDGHMLGFGRDLLDENDELVRR